MNKLSPGPCQNGGPLQLSEPVAVAPSTLTGLDCSKETVTILLAILHGLFHHTLSGDVMVLSLLQAEQTAVKNGVTLAEFERVKKIVLKEWANQRNRNPLSGMF